MTDLVEHAQPETQVSGGQDASFETTVNEITESPAQETSAPRSLDDDLSAIYDRMNGKAAPEPVAKAAAPAKAVETPASEPAPVAAPVADYPSTWDASLKDTWSKLPAEAQKYIAEREANTHQTLNRQQQALKYYEPVAGVLSQMNQLGVQRGAEAEMIQNWMNADRFLSQDPQNAIKWLAQQFNVDLAQLTGAPKPDAQAQQNPIDDLFKDPRYDSLAKQNEMLMQKLAALEQQQQKVVGNLTAREQAEQAKQTEYINTEIAKFAQEKPYFRELEEEITHEVNLIKGREPGLPIDKLLDKAYDRAVYANPQVRERVLADQRKAEAEKQQKEAAAKAAQAKKLSSMNVRTGASASTPTFDGRWDDGDKLSALYDRISSGR